MRHGLFAAAMLLAGCVTAPATETGDALPATISLETGPCFGACPVYRVSVSADGIGRFEGRRFTAVTGTREFRITADQYRAFARHLAPLRPAGAERRYSGEACEMMATDLPSTEIRWQSQRGPQILYFYHGCDMERNRAIAERLEAAPALLPIETLIGGRR